MMGYEREKRRYIHPHVEICRNCGGNGFNMVDSDPILMGKGEIVRRECEVCDGSGRVIVSREVTIKVLAFGQG